jgi:hypothetical protein
MFKKSSWQVLNEQVSNARSGDIFQKGANVTFFAALLMVL